ncbi:MAG: hypothetical protein K6A77_00610, partial [Clostridiales bacterium]|nr:hypothetical protein [Clostridiales bacterium]
MKRRITVVLLVLALLAASTACGHSGKASKPLTPVDHSNFAEDEGVLLEMDFPDYTGKEEWTYSILSNDTEKAVPYGLAQLEVCKDGVWYCVPEKEGIGHTDELPVIPSGSRGAIQVVFTNYEYDFPLGQYRVVVPYSFDDYDASKGWDHIAMAEFSIVKKAKRTEYQPFVGQIYEPDKAVKGGVIAFSGDKIYGEDILETFFYKALSGVPCEMRIVYPELDLCEHYVYTKGCYTIQSYERRAVTTRCYSYLYMDPVTEDLTFSNYVDPDQAAAEGFVVSEPEEIFALNSVSEEIREDVQRVHDHAMDSGTMMRVFLFGPDRSVMLVKVDDTYM